MTRYVLLALCAATATTTLSLVPRDAEARCCYHYRYRVKYYRVHPNYKVLRRAPAPPRWTLGLQVTGMNTDQMLADEGVVLGGMGGHLRYRGYRWGAELAVDVLGADFLDGQITRVSVPIQASALLYLVPEGVFNLYLLGGPRIQPTVITWDYPGLSGDQTFAEFGVHGGLGADLNLGRRFVISADVRFFGVLRSEARDGAHYAGLEDGQMGVLPSDSTGLQFRLGAGFRF